MQAEHDLAGGKQVHRHLGVRRSSTVAAPDQASWRTTSSNVRVSSSRRKPPSPVGSTLRLTLCDDPGTSCSSASGSAGVCLKHIVAVAMSIPFRLALADQQVAVRAQLDLALLLGLAVELATGRHGAVRSEHEERRVDRSRAVGQPHGIWNADSP